MALSKKQRVELRMMFGGKCAYCGCDLPEKGWHADHVEPVLRCTDMHSGAHTGDVRHSDRDVFENHFPSCAPCNLFKTTYSIEGFRKQLERQVERAREYSVNFRNAERFGLIKQTDNKVVFWFEKWGALNGHER